MKQLSVVVLLTLTISACGFHLRGSQQNTSPALGAIFIRSNAAGRVSHEVKAQLKNAGTQTSGSLAEAEYILGLAKETIRRSVLSVSATTGKVDEYQLVLAVSMSVGKPGQDALLVEESIRLTRDYAFDEDAVLGKVAEENLLEQELLRRAAARIIRKLSVAIRSK